MNEQSLKEKLRFIANERNMTFQEVWKKLTLERFLVRLSASKLRDHFVFKGGLLLSYYIELGRETKDIDFLATNMETSEETVREKIEEISETNVNDDFQFNFEKIELLDQIHMNYPGYRVKVGVGFGNMKDSLQLDIGVGDQVNPENFEILPVEYKGRPIFDAPISLRVYPTATIFAEKLETMLYRGATNSRMKDFHDLLLLCQSGILDIDETKRQVDATFSHRQTNKSFPIEFSENDIEKLQNHWQRHLTGLNEEVSSALPARITDVISNINDWVKKAGLSN